MKPWLYLPAHWAHQLSPIALNFFQFFSDPHNPLKSEFHWSPFQWKGIQFPNRLGLAGGVDKDGEFIRAWTALGCGFIEIGTVTPKAQIANPGKIMDRDLKAMAIWNKMGFPSAGMLEIKSNLQSQYPYSVPVFINIGKNRSTPNEEADLDYLNLVKTLHPVADAFVINVSSPNTQGLRDLQHEFRLRDLIRSVKKSAAKFNKPCLIKLSPDLSNIDFNSSIMASLDGGIDGFILTNTTLQRNFKTHFPAEGGVSGEPLKELARSKLIQLVQTLGNEKSKYLIVSVGGVMTTEDVFDRMNLGADLVQVYSALIFQGPFFFRHVAKEVQSRV